MIKKHLFKTSLVQIITSPVFYLSILAVFLSCIFSTEREDLLNVDGNCVTYAVDGVLSLAMASKLIVLCTAFPCVASFCQDWNSQFIRPIVIRSGIGKYNRSKIGVCAIISFVTAFWGLCIYEMFLATYMPIYTNHAVDLQPWGVVGGKEIPVLYLLIRNITFALYSTVWSVGGLMITAYLPNQFVAMISPVVLSYLVGQLEGLLPVYFSTNSLSKNMIITPGGTVGNLTYLIFYFSVLIIIFGYIFGRKVKRRIRNEIV